MSEVKLNLLLQNLLIVNM